MSLALVETTNHLMIQQTERHMGKRKHKPSDPAEIARQRAAARHDPSQWGKNESALSLPANRDILIEPGDRQRTERICRYDVFHILTLRNDGLEPAEAAVRRLEADIATLHRTAGQRDNPKVDGSNAIEAFSHARIEAGENIRAALDLIPKLDAKLLLALTEPSIIEGRSIKWRRIVERVTGELRHVNQGEAVKSAMLALLGAYQAIDNEPRRVAA